MIWINILIKGTLGVCCRYLLTAAYLIMTVGVWLYRVGFPEIFSWYLIITVGNNVPEHLVYLFPLRDQMIVNTEYTADLTPETHVQWIYNHAKIHLDSPNLLHRPMGQIKAALFDLSWSFESLSCTLLSYKIALLLVNTGVPWRSTTHHIQTLI